MKRLFILSVFILCFLTGCVANSAGGMSQTDFMIPENVFGDWKITGFQDAWYISNLKDDGYVKKSIGRIVSFEKDSYKILEYAESYDHDLKTNYRVCDKNSAGKDCDSATLRSMSVGKIDKIITFNTCDPNKKTRYTDCFPAYDLSMYVFENGEIKFMVHSDGGYFVLEKLR